MAVDYAYVTGYKLIAKQKVTCRLQQKITVLFPAFSIKIFCKTEPDKILTTT